MSLDLTSQPMYLVYTNDKYRDPVSLVAKSSIEATNYDPQLYKLTQPSELMARYIESYGIYTLTVDEFGAIGQRSEADSLDYLEELRTRLNVFKVEITEGNSFDYTTNATQTTFNLHHGLGTLDIIPIVDTPVGVTYSLTKVNKNSVTITFSKAGKYNIRIFKSGIKMDGTGTIIVIVPNEPNVDEGNGVHSSICTESFIYKLSQMPLVMQFQTGQDQRAIDSTMEIVNADDPNKYPTDGKPANIKEYFSDRENYNLQTLVTDLSSLNQQFVADRSEGLSTVNVALPWIVNGWISTVFQEVSTDSGLKLVQVQPKISMLNPSKITLNFNETGNYRYALVFDRTKDANSQSGVIFKEYVNQAKGKVTVPNPIGTWYGIFRILIPQNGYWTESLVDLTITNGDISFELQDSESFRLIAMALA